MPQRRLLRSDWRHAPLLLVLLCLLAAGARAGTWAPAPTPSGYTAQFGVLSSTDVPSPQMWLISGLSRLWSTPLGGGPLQWTPFPGTGLGYPWSIANVVVTPQGAPVIAVINVQTNEGQMRWYDASAGTWKAPTPASYNFAFGEPRMTITQAGDILASQADVIYASTDGGQTYAVRTAISDWMQPPAPLVQGGAAAGFPSFGTNAPSIIPGGGYSLAFALMPWGELFLGTEANAEWHSYDDGNSWEQLDPLYNVPIRDMNGKPLYTNPHRMQLCLDGNTAAAGYTKDAEILVNCDQNNGFNFNRMTTTGLLIQLDNSALNLSNTNLGQTHAFHTLKSGETLSAAVPWDGSNGAARPSGHNASEIVRWDGSALSFGSPLASAGWGPLSSDGSMGASDGTVYYTLTSGLHQNLYQYTPDPQTNERPQIQLVSSPLTTSMSPTGVATVQPGSAFTVTDDGQPNGTLSYRWTARGQGPVTFDWPFSASPTATFTQPGHYVLTLTVSDGAAQSGMSVLVHVKPASGGTAPTITTEPKNATLVPGQPVQLSLTATGSSLSYHWFRNGVALVDGATYSGTATNTLVIKSARVSDMDSIYHCVVTSPFGRALSHGAMLGGPVALTVQPLNQTVPAGTSATLSVAADGSHPMTWQWYSVSGGTRTPVASGGNQSAYTTSTPGTYQVDVTNPFGTVTSATATLSNGSATTFTLSTPFVGATSTAGSGTYALGPSGSGPIGITTDRFTVASAPSRFVKWTTTTPGVQFGNATSPQTSVTVPASAAGLSISVTPTYAATKPYGLSVVNGIGSGVTTHTTFQPGSTVEIAALPPPAGMKFDHWVGGPIDGSMNASASFAMPAADTVVTATYTFSSGAVLPAITTGPQNQAVLAGQTATFSVNASGTAPLSYQWKRGGSPIQGATSASYTTAATMLSDDGAQFTVVVANAAGSVESSPATLTVTAPPVAPQITTPPADATVLAGQTATFSVSANGTAPLSYQWKRNGQAIAGASSASYTTPATTLADDGTQFTVVVSNTAGSVESSTATLTVTPPPMAPQITSQPLDASVMEGSVAIFSVSASGTAPLSYRWKRNGVVIPNANSASYTTPPAISADDGAQFTVVVSNDVGSVESDPATLTVIPLPVAPQITTPPMDASVLAGQTATFAVMASGTAPLSYQWRRDGQAISGATGASYTTAATTLADDGAQFTVVISNVVGSAESSPATLTVTAAPAAPQLTTLPADAAVKVGTTATFSVVATGTAPLSYQWKRNGTAISEATNPSYTTDAVSDADTGASFTVVVSNPAGVIESAPAHLTVLDPPTISRSPDDVTVAEGATATFAVTATGTAPLTYQWRRNGTPLANETAPQLTLAHVSAGDDGARFSVEVTNVVGSATSTEAILHVQVAPTSKTPVKSGCQSAGSGTLGLLLGAVALARRRRGK